jgi:hypothetical protein
VSLESIIFWKWKQIDNLVPHDQKPDAAILGQMKKRDKLGQETFEPHTVKYKNILRVEF